MAGPVGVKGSRRLLASLEVCHVQCGHEHVNKARPSN